MDLTRLDSAVHRYCHLGLAASTHKAYRAAVNRFSTFCIRHDITHPFPVNELLLCRFIASLAQEGLSPATLKTYLAGIRHAQVMRGFPEPAYPAGMPRLKLLQTGVARDRANHRTGGTGRERLPITPQLLEGLLRVWSAPKGNTPAEARDRAMLRAAATTCFFGFFRSGEITVPTQTAFDTRIHLAWGDVALDDAKPPSMVRIHLKRSKCDQFGKGVDVFMGRTGKAICPVSEVLEYVTLRGPTPGPFFLFSGGSPLTKAAFVKRVRDALTTLGVVDPASYAGHSFRIGAATAASEAGLEDSVIKSLGRWSSDAFHRYIRTPRDQLAALSGVLARTKGPGKE